VSTAQGLPDAASIGRTAELLAAAAHPTRLLVLLALSRRGPLCAGDLWRLARSEQTAMSHQRRTLRDAGLVRSERRGKHLFYELCDHHVAHIVEDAVAHTSEQRPKKKRPRGR